MRIASLCININKLKEYYIRKIKIFKKWINIISRIVMVVCMYNYAKNINKYTYESDST